MAPPAGLPSPQNLLANDPSYAQAQTDYQAALAAAASKRDAGTNQALVQFGSVPDFGSVGKSLGLSDAQVAAITGEINPGTSELAGQYTNSGDSVLAQLNHAHDQALKQLRAGLAARGMLESGSTGIGVGQENDNYQSGLSNAYQQLLSNLLGFQDSYASTAGDARSGLESSLSSAYDRAVQMAQQMPGLYATPSSESPGTAAGIFPLPSQAALQSAAATDPATVSRIASTIGASKPRRALVNPYVTGQKVYG